MRQLSPLPMNQTIRHTAFDDVAAEYDAVFTRTPLGERQRAIVRRYAERIVRPTFRVLELNCGTGEDALWLAGRAASVVATDAAPAMVELAAAKGADSPLTGRLSYRTLRIEDLAGPELRRELGTFDLIYSNFDGLNCVADLTWLPDALAELLQPGGHLLLVFMNPVCAMEIAGNLARLRPRRAFQRMKRGGIPVHIGQGTNVHTWFHPVGRTIETFGRGFVLRRTEAVGLITPPTSMREFYNRHERSFRRMFAAEDRLARLWPFNRLGDHVLIHFQSRT